MTTPDRAAVEPFPPAPAAPAPAPQTPRGGGPDPVEQLRAAAAKVREMARGTTAAPWFIADCDLHPRWILGQPQPGSPYAEDVAKSYTDGGGDGLYVSDADWKWMAFAHPRWAEPIAALLEGAADDFVEGTGCPTAQAALAVARAVLGKETQP